MFIFELDKIYLADTATVKDRIVWILFILLNFLKETEYQVLAKLCKNLKINLSQDFISVNVRIYWNFYICKLHWKIGIFKVSHIYYSLTQQVLKINWSQYTYVIGWQSSNKSISMAWLWFPPIRSKIGPKKLPKWCLTGMWFWM